MGKRRKRGNKGSCQLAHTKRRLLARYGLELDISEIRGLARKIHQNRPSANGVLPECLGRQSNRLTIWALSYRGAVLTLVYDSIRHTIVTALPPGAGLPGGAPVKALVCKQFEKEEEATPCRSRPSRTRVSSASATCGSRRRGRGAGII